MIKKRETILVLAVVLALIPLVFLGMVTGVTYRVSAAPTHVTAVYATGATCDPVDPAWSLPTTGVTSLNQSFETYYAPMRFLLPPNVPNPLLPNRELEISAIHNGADLCIKFKWADSTKNDTFDDPNRFMDAMAFGIPFNGDVTPIDPPQPWPIDGDDWRAKCGAQAYHMGSTIDVNGDPTTDCATNLVAWMGDFAAGDLAENFTAVGIGTVTEHDSGLLPTATYGQYDDLSQTWTVVFQRPLDPSSLTPNMVKLELGHEYLIGYVVWDGSLQERDGRKFVTEDWADTLVIAPVP